MKILIAPMALLLFAFPAFAQERDLTLFGGVITPGKITLSGAPAAGASGAAQIITDPANVGLFGVRVGHGKVWGGEHTIAFAPNFLDSNSKAFVYNSNFRLQAPLPVVVPYLTGGMGTIYSWGSGVSDLGMKFAFNYGGGVKWMFQRNAGLHLSVRQYLMPRVQSQTLNITEVSLGLVVQH